MENDQRKSLWCPDSKRRTSYAKKDEIYRFGVHFSQRKHSDQHIEFLDRVRESQRKASSPILQLLQLEGTQHSKLPGLPQNSRSNASQEESTSTSFWKANQKKILRTSDTPVLHPNYHTMNTTLNSIFFKRDNPIEKNIQLGTSKLISKSHEKRRLRKPKQNSMVSNCSEVTPLSSCYFQPKELSKEVMKSIYATSTPSDCDRTFTETPNVNRPNMKLLLQKMARMTRRFYPKHTLIERDIVALQDETAVSRYEIYNLFSAHNALLEGYRQSNSFHWEGFKKDLAMILRVRSEFIDKVMLKCLGEIEQPEERVLEFVPFLKFVKKVREYDYQQRLIEFIDVLFDVNKSQASYEEVVAMFTQYKQLRESQAHTQTIFGRLQRSHQEEISKEELKELCINDVEVFRLLSQLINRNERRKDDCF